MLLLSQSVNVQGVHIQHDAPGCGGVFSLEPRDDVLEGRPIGQVDKFIDIDLKSPSFIGEHVMHEGTPQDHHAEISGYPGQGRGNRNGITIRMVAFYKNGVRLIQEIFDGTVVGTVIQEYESLDAKAAIVPKKGGEKIKFILEQGQQGKAGRGRIFACYNPQIVIGAP